MSLWSLIFISSNSFTGKMKMGEAKIPIYAYVDESGNTGKNIFDEAQPDYFTAALVNVGDFDDRWGCQIGEIAKSVGAEAIHANGLGFGKLESIAPNIYTLLVKSKAHFFISRVETRYLLATKMFDVLFDSGENAAVAWHNYNIRPLKIMLAFKLAGIIEETTAREFWNCLLLPSEDESRKMLPAICESLKACLHLLPDERSRTILGEGLDWVIKHPETIHFANEQKIARQGHFPNFVAFTTLLDGLQHYSKLWKMKFARITHDEQSEFGKLLQTWHSAISNAAPDVIEWAGESYTIQKVPGSQFVILRDDQSPGIQMADVPLWLYVQSIKGREIPPGCAQILTLVLQRGWQNDFSFAGVEKSMMEKWGEVFFGPIDPEKLEVAQKMLDEAEKRRLQSMKRYEIDGLAPFMRDSLPKPHTTG
jgi:hypothetical protein